MKERRTKFLGHRQSASGKIRSPSPTTINILVTGEIQSTTPVDLGETGATAAINQPTSIDENPKQYVEEITQALEVVLKARTPFHTAVAIPAVLMLVVTATIFRDAYNMFGDNNRLTLLPTASGFHGWSSLPFWETFLLQV